MRTVRWPDGTTVRMETEPFRFDAAAREHMHKALSWVVRDERPAAVARIIRRIELHAWLYRERAARGARIDAAKTTARRHLTAIMKALPPLERAVAAAVTEHSDLSRGAAALHLAIQQFRDFEGHVVWASPARSGGGRSGKGAFDPYRLLLDIGIADALEPVVETLTWSKPTSILQTVIRRTHAALGLRTTNHAVRESARDAINELEHWRRQSRLVRFSPRLRSGQVYCTGKSRGR